MGDHEGESEPRTRPFEIPTDPHPDSDAPQEPGKHEKPK
ncbi:hypothetical protein FHS44_007504 [Streptosporangium saharense]|uniref:Uncharacterized protein n=1 Tax=Streptosporangium saharense TaxID=1706840 RepID=A0A7W7VSE7_9ACTN|nr:hypothetical protein [Streptosporangium saharense]